MSKIYPVILSGGSGTRLWPLSREAYTKQFLDRAVEEGEYIDILFHKIPPENLPAFREMVAILAQYRPYIKTYDEIIP